jgi:hypothetical protein
LVIGIVGGLMVLTVLVQFVVAVAQRVPFSLKFWSLMAAAETAAWRLKWVGIVWCLIVLFGSHRLYKSIQADPERFCGLRYARRGLRAAVVACLLVTGFIGISVPARLKNIQISREAAYQAHVHRYSRAVIEYGLKYKTLPSDPLDVLRLPDPDGSLSAAVKELGPLSPGAYKPSGADLAALPNQKRRNLRGAVIKNASVDSATDDTLTPGLAFTNYELRLAGPDKIVGTDDDLVLRDGLITKASEAGPGVIGSTASFGAIKH